MEKGLKGVAVGVLSIGVALGVTGCQEPRADRLERAAAAMEGEPNAQAAHEAVREKVSNMPMTPIKLGDTAVKRVAERNGTSSKQVLVDLATRTAQDVANKNEQPAEWSRALCGIASFQPAKDGTSWVGRDGVERAWSEAERLQKEPVLGVKSAEELGRVCLDATIFFIDENGLLVLPSQSTEGAGTSWLTRLW